ncbi:RNA-binding S4 domain-containing protein [Rothia nasimurium]|uniref:RNA-binding S4 domain-containing protein n=1 Tax=Rothia nasimurium TaxID=85336 RepID=UPI003B9F4FE2
MTSPVESPQTEPQVPVRLDAWLWAVRVFKTRSLASTEVKAGHVRLNGDHTKPSQKIKPGDTVTVRYPGWERVLIVRKTIAKRVGAPVAVTCYEDISAPKPAYLTSGVLPKRDRGTGRPTKNERRALNKLRGYEKE